MMRPFALQKRPFRHRAVLLIATLCVSLLCVSLTPSVADAAQPKLIIGSEDGFGAQLYGFARLDIIYNSRTFDHPQFPNFVPVGPGGDGQVNIHPRLSRLGFKTWSGLLLGQIDVGATIEFDFQNGGSESRQAVRMRHAFAHLKLKGGFYLLAGQTWDLVSQLYPMANADSMMWNTGNLGDRAPQLRLGFRATIGDGKLDMALALLMPSVTDTRDLDENGTPDGQDSGLPGFQARVGYKASLWTKRPFQIAVGGLLTKTETQLAGQTQSWTSWGVMAELDIPLHDVIGIRGEWFMGQDLAEVRGGIKQGLKTTTDAAGLLLKASEVRTMGFWAELYAQPTSYLRLAAGYGQDDPEDADLSSGGRALNRAFWGVVHWRIVPPFRVGVEYLHWKTDYLSGKTDSVSGLTAEAHRIDVHFAYFF